MGIPRYTSVSTLRLRLLLLLTLLSLFGNAQDFFVIQKIEVTGNKTTKDRIILRELEFKTGDTLHKADRDQVFRSSRENLMNTALFNFVTITHQDSSGTVTISVTERWYLWPFPLLEVVERDINVWLRDPDFRKINYGIFIDRENFRGRKESLKFLARTGFDQELGVGYRVPYLDKKQRIGMNLVLTASRNHMVPFRSVGNVLQYLNDQENFSLKEFNTFLQLNCRQGLYYNYIVQLGYTQATLSDSLRFGNPAYFNNGKNYKQFLYAGFRFVSDYRDSRNYPLRGHYIEVHLNKQGFGVLGNDNTDMLSAGINLKKFFRAAPRLHISAGSQAKISNRFFQPYYLQKGLGYGNQFIRGYEYYVIDGQSYAMYKTALKYTLIKNREFHISFIPSEKFSRGYYALYLNLFSDGGYVWDRQWGNVNPLSNLYLSSAGIGLDLVTYYDKVVRIEFSVNHMSESGLFLHFLAPI